jgi:hypothetical protein
LQGLTAFIKLLYKYINLIGGLVLIYFQSRYLAEKFHIKIAKWKRWSREFLPPDPLGGQRSGYARQFSYKEAFHVYLAGYLVGTLRFTVAETKQILSDMEPWLIRQGFFALPLARNRTQPTDAFCVYIIPLTSGDFGYVVQSSKRANPFQSNAHASFDLNAIGRNALHFDQNTIFGARLLLINNLYRFFLNRLNG